jgi:hypothetical protein
MEIEISKLKFEEKVHMDSDIKLQNCSKAGIL